MDIEEIYEIGRCVDFIKENGHQNVALQFPDSMLKDSVAVAKKFQEKGIDNAFILADTSYGSYDIDEVAAKHVKADLIIHYGQSALTTSHNTRTLFVFGSKKITEYDDICKVFREIHSNLEQKIILLSESPFYYLVDPLYNLLKVDYLKLEKSEISIPFEPGTVLNQNAVSCINNCPNCACESAVPLENTSQLTEQLETLVGYEKDKQSFGAFKISLEKNAKLEDYSIFYIGNYASETLRNILLENPNCTGNVYDPVSLKCQSLPSYMSRFLRRRCMVVEKVKDAKTVGIIVGTMGMERYLDIIKYLKKIIKVTGKKCYTFVVGKLNPPKLANFIEIDIFVLVACPEESLIDASDYFKPIAIPFEVEVACNGNRTWGTEYVTDFRDILKGGKSYVEFKNRMAEPDISFITGQMRESIASTAAGGGDEQVSLRNNETALAVFHPFSSASFYAGRSWKGLEQKLGETPVVLAEKGRSGVPVNYNEMSET